MNAAVRAGYKQSEVGVIPEDWKVVKFGGLVDYVKGFPFKSTEYSINGVRVIRVSDTSYDAILDDNRIYVTEHSAAQCAKWALKNYDLLISTVGSKPPMYDSMVGKVVLVTTGHEGALLNQNSVLVRDKQRRPHLQQILLGHFRTKRYVIWIETILRGNANQASITLKDLFEFSIPLASQDVEQRAIATALSDVDALLAKLNALIAKKRDLKVATMQQLLTGQTRLPGFSGEWEVKRLGDVATLKNGYTFESETYTSLGSYKVITIANVQDGYMVTEGCNAVDRTPSDIQPHQLLKIGDILISMTGNVGRVCRVCEDRCLLNQRVGKLVPTSVSEAFLFALLREQSFIVAMSGAAKGGAQPNLSAGDIAGYEICIPSETSEQAAIAQVLCDMDTERTALETRREKTRAIKQGMMQELLTGRIRLI